MKENEEVMYPYEVSDFKDIRESKSVYIDKTEYIKKLEREGKYLTFLRPRRFGKSLFTSMLMCYYDFRCKDEFDTLFGDLYIGKNPTENRNNYYVLNFGSYAIYSKNISSLYTMNLNY